MYIYTRYRLQMLDECFWWVLFIRIAEALKNMKVNEAVQFLEIKFGSRRKFILVFLKPCSWKGSKRKNQLNKLTISHLLPPHLNITVAWCWVLLRLSKHLKNRKKSMLFYVKSMRFKCQQVHTSKSSTIEDIPQGCHDKEGSRERFGVFLRLVLPICATSLDCTGASWSEV